MTSKRRFRGLNEEVVEEKYRILTQERGLDDQQISEIATQMRASKSFDDVITLNGEELQDFIDEMECRKKQMTQN